MLAATGLRSCPGPSNETVSRGIQLSRHHIIKMVPMFVHNKQKLFNLDENCYEATIFHHESFYVQISVGCLVYFEGLTFKVHMDGENGYLTYYSKRFQMSFSKLVLYVTSADSKIVILYGCYGVHKSLRDYRKTGINETVKFSYDIFLIPANSVLEYDILKTTQVKSTNFYEYLKLDALNNTNCYYQNRRSCLWVGRYESVTDIILFTCVFILTVFSLTITIVSALLFLKYSFC